ncbi:MAG: hypothetical protein JJ958_11870 [Balneola sp.]|nr:hypothetical protein [Balneola sp.]|tara:strand:- start:1290 stop:1667 length:378 start_codon:yes stop_codon:yes gene_type:complete
MGLFDFFKPEKNDLNNELSQLINKFFPKGKKDINAGTQELMRILDTSILEEEARNIFIKSVAISRISENFDDQRLKDHLSGYCIQYFDQKKIKQFHSYLVALNAAMLLQQRTPSEVRREGDSYIW